MQEGLIGKCSLRMVQQERLRSQSCWSYGTGHALQPGTTGPGKGHKAGRWRIHQKRWLLLQRDLRLWTRLKRCKLRLSGLQSRVKTCLPVPSLLHLLLLLQLLVLSSRHQR